MCSSDLELNVASGITSAATLSGKALSITTDAPNGFTGSGSFSGNLSVGNHLFVTSYSNLAQLNVDSVEVHNSLHANDTISANTFTVSKDLSTGNLTASGNTNLGNVTASGNLSAGNINGGNLVSASYLSGDGYLISNLTVPAEIGRAHV